MTLILSSLTGLARKLLIILVILLFPLSAIAWTEFYSFDSLSTNPYDGGTDGFYSVGGTGEKGTITLSTTRAHSGSKSAKFEFLSDSGCIVGNESGQSCDNVPYGVVQKNSNFEQGDEVWVSWYMYTETGWSWYNGKTRDAIIKVFRFRLNPSYVSVLVGNAGSYPDNMSPSSGMWPVGGIEGRTCSPFFPIMTTNCSTQNWTSSNPIKLDSSMNEGWHHWEMYIKFHSDAETGKVKVWIDSDLQVDWTVNTLNSSGNIVTEQPFMFHTWNGGVGQDQVAYVDDVYLSTDGPYSESGDPSATISGLDTQANESGDTGTATVSCPLCDGDTVVITRGGTAEYDVDYTDDLSSPISSYPTTITVTPINKDSSDTGSRTVIYTPGTCTTCNASGTATITINDDDSGETDPPIIGGVLPSPITVNCTAGQQETEVVFGLSNVTDDSPTITCKYRGYSGFDWSVGNALTASGTGASGENHTKSGINFTCGNTYTYYAKCQDSIGNESADQEIQFTVIQATSREVNFDGSLYIGTGSGSLTIDLSP